MYIFDAHIDTAMRLVSTKQDLAGLREGHVTLGLFEEGSIAAQVFAVFVPTELRAVALSAGLEMVEAVLMNIQRYSDKLSLITKPTDFTKAEEDNKLACVLSLEGGEPLAGKISHLKTFYRLGVRAITLTWNNRNELADGVGEGKRSGGLSEFGLEVVNTMNSLGMVIDVSHLAETGFWQVIGESKDPIIASHSNAKALWDHRRNLTDQQIQAIADSGGVIGVNFCPAFLGREGEVTIDDVVNQIYYLRSVGGTDVVALGSDFDGIGTPPKGLENIGKMPEIARALEKRGLPEAEIDKVMGRNLLRVFQQVIKGS